MANERVSVPSTREFYEAATGPQLGSNLAWWLFGYHRGGRF